MQKNVHAYVLKSKQIPIRDWNLLSKNTYNFFLSVEI